MSALISVWASALVSVLLLALSESLTWTETVELASPSGKVQSKLPPVASVVVEPTWLPLAPQPTLRATRPSRSSRFAAWQAEPGSPPNADAPRQG